MVILDGACLKEPSETDPDEDQPTVPDEEQLTVSAIISGWQTDSEYLGIEGGFHKFVFPSNRPQRKMFTAKFDSNNQLVELEYGYYLKPFLVLSPIQECKFAYSF